MQVKFEKGSEPYTMFNDYYKLMQKYWGVESSENYWSDLVKDAEKFAKKYENIPCGVKLGVALVTGLHDSEQKRVGHTDFVTYMKRYLKEIENANQFG